MLTVTGAECHIKALYTECRYAECRYAECRYAECCYAECRGVAIRPFPRNFDLKSKKSILNRLYL